MCTTANKNNKAPIVCPSKWNTAAQPYYNQNSLPFEIFYSNSTDAVSITSGIRGDSLVPSSSSSHGGGGGAYLGSTRGMSSNAIETITIDSNDKVHRQPRHRQQQYTNKNKTAHRKQQQQRKQQLGTNTADWIVITGIPPLSTLDDLLPDIQRIFATELQKGIIDLDRGEEFILRQQQQQQQPRDLVDEEDADVSNTTTAQPLPLWNPSLQQHDHHHHNNNEYHEHDDDTAPQRMEPPTPTQPRLPPHLVIEARMMISSSARIKGWYLRLPNRSCVYAFLQHLKEAQQFKLDFERIVWEEERRNLTMSQGDDDEPNPDHHDDDDEATPMPQFSWDMTDTRPLTCAWKEVTVSSFDPNRKPYRNPNNNHYSKPEKIWHQFYDGVKWGLGDNVVRVENCPARTSDDDLRYLFDSYGLLDCRISRRALGAASVGTSEMDNDNYHNNNKKQAVKQKTIYHYEQVERIATSETVLPVTTKEGDSRASSSRTTAKKKQRRVTLHTYLVRFESAASARAAVRDKQAAEVRGGTILLSRYSRQIL